MEHKLNRRILRIECGINKNLMIYQKNKVRDFNYVRKENGKTKDAYDDKRMRNIFIEFAKNNLSIEFSEGTDLGIDCVCVNDPNWGAEGENASWSGNRWTSNQADLFRIGVNTLNIQHSKWHYSGIS